MRPLITGCATVGTLLVLLAGSAGPFPASLDDSSVRGRVVGSSGAGRPGVTLVLVNEKRKLAMRTVSGDNGVFAFSPLAPGDGYVLATVDRPTVEAGSRLLSLEPGATVTVTFLLADDGAAVDRAAAEERPGPVDTESSATRHTYHSGFVEALPIIGHDYQDVLVLAPGVTDPDGNGNPNVHGARETELAYSLDGADITDPISATFGMNLNPLIIERIDLTTAGAPAEYGRASGGFARITTRSGTNDLDGRLAVFWQGDALNGDGAGNNDVNNYEPGDPRLRDLRLAASLGGPIVRDRLWYFGSVELLDREASSNSLVPDLTIETRGAYWFGKLSWQPSPENSLTLQAAGDPLTFKGLGLSFSTSPDSDFELEQGALAVSLKWSSTIDERLSVEGVFSHLDSEVSITPVSDLFHPIPAKLLVTGAGGGAKVQIRYPCETINCRPGGGEEFIYREDLISGAVNGPFYIDSDETRARNALGAAMNWELEGPAGRHRLGAGFHLSDERFGEDRFTNPILLDSLVGSGPQVSGVQFVQVANPYETRRRAENFATSLYVSDSWKPSPGLAVNAGVRFDREDLEAPGFAPFDPVEERREAIALWKAFCQEAAAQNLAPIGSNCNPGVPYNGLPPTNIFGTLSSFRDTDMDGINDVAPAIAALDIDQDGHISLIGFEGQGLFQHFTTYLERQPSNLEIRDAHLSPRIGVAWDPWQDGRTRLFAHWGRYHDRLAPTTVLGESDPETLIFAFLPNPQTRIILPGVLSDGTSLGAINGVARDLVSPHTDELSLGVEREILPEWSLGLSFVRRKGYDLLQDVDRNHYTCPQVGAVLGLDPMVICGDGQKLDLDRFGAIRASSLDSTIGGDFTTTIISAVPNGLVDLYTVNNGYGQILEVDNLNSYDYRAVELTMARRLYRNWQMKASYTLSRTRGQAEFFRSIVGNDPSLVEQEEGYLDYDQRHSLEFQAVAHLPADVILGWSVQWSSGTPWTVVDRRMDLDSTGTLIDRTIYINGRRNDQRNKGAWRIDGRVEKKFNMGAVSAGGFLIVQNLLNSDDLSIEEELVDFGIAASRDFGRRFEIGAIIDF